MTLGGLIDISKENIFSLNSSTEDVNKLISEGLQIIDELTHHNRGIDRIFNKRYNKEFIKSL